MLQDVITAVFDGKRKVEVIGGRYGLGSKEFTPGMCKAVFDELSKPEAKRRFTVGINDDIGNLSLAYDDQLDIESKDVVRAVFWGLGSDGTVGANKNSIKIIGEETSNFAQGYFVYDSKKSGSVTISHLRFGPRPIHAPYLVRNAGFVAVHHFQAMPVVVLPCFVQLHMLAPAATWSLHWLALLPEFIQLGKQNASALHLGTALEPFPKDK